MLYIHTDLCVRHAKLGLSCVALAVGYKACRLCVGLGLFACRICLAGLLGGLPLSPRMVIVFYRRTGALPLPVSLQSMHHFYMAQDEILEVDHILGLPYQRLHGYVISVNAKEYSNKDARQSMHPADAHFGMQCGFGVVDTPADDKLVIGVDGSVAYNQSSSSEYSSSQVADSQTAFSFQD